MRDPKTADKLMPDHYVMTKRPILEDGYFETYNRDNVTLVDLREDPIERFTKTSVITRSGEHPIDMLVLATGFDLRDQRVDAAAQSEGTWRRASRSSQALPQLYSSS
ncbi:MAG: hypothetical protein R3E53_00480 [Myxococcota bacterium]